MDSMARVSSQHHGGLLPRLHQMGGYPTRSRGPPHSAGCVQHFSPTGIPTSPAVPPTQLAASAAPPRSPTGLGLSSIAFLNPDTLFVQCTHRQPLLVQRISWHSASVLNRKGMQTLWRIPLQQTQRPVKHRRFSCVCSLHAKLPSLHLATVGVLAGRSTPPLSHGPHLSFGHPDPR